MPAPDVPVVFARWESFTLWLFQRTASFPRRLRHSLTHRIETTCLDIHEALVDARFSRDRVGALRHANVRMDSLRLLLRLATELRCLSHKQAAHAHERIDECGRMVGGWLRSLR